MIQICFSANEVTGKQLFGIPVPSIFFRTIAIVHRKSDIALRVVCISDTHELHRELVVPDGDLLIHAGDFTFFGRETRAIVDFNDWLGDLPHPHKIVTCGNHEYAFESDRSLHGLITNATLLLNESATVGPAKVWASPLTPHFGGTFGRSNAEERLRAYRAIPADVDILVTHGPPYGILDHSPSDYREPAGDKELREAVIRARPKLHVFGHIHSGYGVRPTRHTVFVNAALFGLDGSLENRPIVLELSQFKKHEQ
jgi:predicted phosphohydrolase